MSDQDSRRWEYDPDAEHVVSGLPEHIVAEVERLAGEMVALAESASMSQTSVKGPAGVYRGADNCSRFRSQMSSLIVIYGGWVKLSEWAQRQGVSYQTAWRWVKAGKMPVPVRQAPSGTWIVEDAPVAQGRVVAYCRVSSADQKGDLERQVTRVVTEATKLGLAVGEVVTEIGWGLNGKRRKLHRVLADPDAAVIVVEHRDRLARFGVEHLESALTATGRKLVVLDPEETTDDLVRDMTEVLTSMCARLYGQRAAKNRAARAVAIATGEGAE